MLFYLIAEGILLVLLAFLSAAEAAVLAANRWRAKFQSEHGGDIAKAAGALIRLHQQKENFLPAILAAETLLTVLMSTLGTYLAVSLHPGTKSLLVAALIITALILLFGEILPKTLAIHKPEWFAYKAAPILLLLTKFLSFFLKPVTWTLRQMLKLGRDSSHAIPTEKELKYLISLSREHGILQKEEEELLQNIFDFTDAKVKEIMIPRTQVASLDADATFQEALDKFAETRFSRFPVHTKDLDHVLGFLDIRDLLPAIAKKKDIQDLRAFIRPAVFVPESKRIGTLLQDMRHQNFHMAIAVDEYGGAAGLISLTDLIEEIVGKLESNAKVEEISPWDEKTLIVPASAKLQDVEKKLGYSFESNEYATIGGLVLGLFGRIPNQGEQIRHRDLLLSVTGKKGHKIHAITITRKPEVLE